MVQLLFRLHDADDADIGDILMHTFGDASTAKDLRDHIHTVLKVDPKYQIVFINRDDRRVEQFTALDEIPLKETRVKHGDTLVVKHAMLGEWEDYQKEVHKLMTLSEKEIRGGSTSRGSKADRNLRKNLLLIAEKAAKYLETLEQARFFSAYREFNRIRNEQANRTGFWLLHMEKKWFLKAVQAYFEERCSQASVTCAIVEGAGIQTACRVNLEWDDKSTAYYAKFMAGMNSGLELKSKNLHYVDLREIFVYRLLSLINVGSEEVLVIRDAAESGYVYLATKIIHGFWTRDGRSVEAAMQGIKDKDEEKWRAIDKESRGVMEKQLEILVWLLGLEDLGLVNQANWGYVETQTLEGGLAHELKVVDFTVQAEKKACKKEVKEPFNQYVTTTWKIEDNIAKALDQVQSDPAIAKKFGEDDKAGKTKEAVRLDEYIEYIRNHIREVAEPPKGNESLKRKTASEGEGKNEKKEKKEDGGN
ncbi:unnamed protein product, partial [Mesorhabditis belari]|uniref:Nuclear pore localisation protein Npl4 ubiquitin-like domain-containing protein n=1 Tax=Mesorhabditis belari TaxID=2138241 RepID=A0AAF3J5M5_9BILA